MKKHIRIYALFFLFCLPFVASSQGFNGYYQYPDIHNDRIVFCAEGDLWTVSTDGGLATRLTTHAEREVLPRFSPDGKLISFSASYEGPTEIYTMPSEGGMPTRWSYERESSISTAWTPNGDLVYTTTAYNKKPDERLVQINLSQKTKTHIPLDQASEASYDGTGATIFFVRPADHGNVTKRYQGGTARQIWKFTKGQQEAVKLTGDHLGESHHPQWYDGRVYFLSDRDGIMNVWSMDEGGADVVQHTDHTAFDVRHARVSKGRIVYQLGADLWLHDIDSGSAQKLEIRLASDLEQLRDKWDANPSRYITSVQPDPTGDNVVITARGRVFVKPTGTGRSIAFADKAIRYRDATFSHDGKQVLALSDESGEFEFVSLPSNGLGEEKTITNDGKVLRYAGVPSPDGKYIAYDDLLSHMYVLDVATGKSQKISTNQEGIYDFSWSPDSKWLAFVQVAENTMAQIFIHHIETSEQFALTTDRANSFNPCWSPDGQFIYFLSDRNFQSLVGSPWGSRQPEPYFDASEKVFHVALQPRLRSPFRPQDELQQEEAANKEKDAKDDKDSGVNVIIDRHGIQHRIAEVPVKPGNYSSLAINDKALYLLSRETGLGAKTHLSAIKIDSKKPQLKTIVRDVRSYRLTSNGKKILVRKGSSYYMVSAGTSEISKLADAKIDLSGWKFKITPKDDWQQIFTDAWRMERDYFYDQNMHGVDWDKMHAKYATLLPRVTTRQELSDLIGRFVGELSALHTSVRGGDLRRDQADISVASLGAITRRDVEAGGFVIDYIYKADPDYPHERSPLDDPYLGVKEGDVITMVNGKAALTAFDIGALIRNEVGNQVRLTIKNDAGTRDVIVNPVGSTYNLRYRDWEYGNRLHVEKESDNKIGYLHLRAMSRNDINQFYREFYPIFNRQGLIIDVRYNFGGNIDSFILEKLLRRAWMYWSGRSGKPSWNMQYAFRGHIVVLVNENTYSDGEAFADGFRRLGLGATIGTRTWGGEIWLSSVNRLSDNGLARAPMNGVYADGEWLIEGHGFEPDIELDNLPHATFKGEDAQLDRGIQHLLQLIDEDPREVPPPPPFPDKSFGENSKSK
ncbi:MAG: PDZ domain-containing protein [Saprospiraceae bacterium]|nr:PDZ domain-containing protein [Saprospiraceae bacterium]